MLSKKQKTDRFKQKVIENYRASLSLEGISVRKISPNKNIGDLKVKYAQ
ncbi:MAG: DUF2559 family protein [Gammaproteobacteria bacterium]|nr:DUF2559 family protein [Gammaproteobacteria bacterium]